MLEYFDNSLIFIKKFINHQKKTKNVLFFIFSVTFVLDKSRKYIKICHKKFAFRNVFVNGRRGTLHKNLTWSKSQKMSNFVKTFYFCSNIKHNNLKICKKSKSDVRV